MSAANELQCMILCGGMGTRLREETTVRPKPMVRIGRHPILWHIMKCYREYGVRDFVLCLGYLGDVIREYFHEYRNRSHDSEVDLATGAVRDLEAQEHHVDWRVILAETGEKSLTGTRIATALRYIRGDRFLATYGDGVADVDIAALIAHHQKLGKLATVTAVHPSSRFGELAIEGDVIQAFQEKPQVTEGWINGGFFVFEKAAFDHFDEAGDDASLEAGLLEKLAAMGELAVYRHPGFWQCMDTYREMEFLNELWKRGDAPWKNWA